MPDIFTREKRSWVMSRIRRKDTKPERRLLLALHASGLRYRKQYRAARGRPDAAFPRARVLVFMDGDFWHGYRLPAWEGKLKAWWREKLRRNRRRDRNVTRALRRAGWTVVRVWEHQVKDELEDQVLRIRQEVRLGLKRAA